MATNCAPAGVGAYGCIFSIPFLVGDAIALPKVELRCSNMVYSLLLVVFVPVISWTALSLSTIAGFCKKHSFDHTLGANIRYQPHLTSFAVA